MNCRSIINIHQIFIQLKISKLQNKKISKLQKQFLKKCFYEKIKFSLLANISEIPSALAGCNDAVGDIFTKKLQMLYFYQAGLKGHGVRLNVQGSCRNHRIEVG